MVPVRTPSSHRRHSQAIPEPDEICDYYMEGRRSISYAHAHDQRRPPPTQAGETEGAAKGGRDTERGMMVRRELVYDSEEEDSDIDCHGSGSEGVPNTGHKDNIGREGGERRQGRTATGLSETGRSPSLLGVQKSASLSRPHLLQSQSPSLPRGGGGGATFRERAKDPRRQGIKSTFFTRLIRPLQGLLLPAHRSKQPSRPFIQFKDGPGGDEGTESQNERVGLNIKEARQRRHLKWFLLLGLIVLLVMALLLFFLWPRRPLLRIMAVERDTRAGAEGFTLLTMSGLVQVNASSRVQAQVVNNNWLPITVRTAKVTGWWRLAREGEGEGGEGKSARQLLGSALLKAPIRIARRRQQNVTLPFEVSLWGNPVNDTIFTDYYRRCIIATRGEQEGQEDGRSRDEGLQVDYEIDVEVGYLGIRSKRHLTYNQGLPCLMGPDQVAEILRGAHVNIRQLPPGVADALGRFGDSIQRALSATKDDGGRDRGWLGKKLESRLERDGDKHQNVNDGKEDIGEGEEQEQEQGKGKGKGETSHPNGNSLIKY